MACTILTTRLAAIYDTILAVQREDPSVETLSQIQEWFKDKYGTQIDPQEITDSLVATTQKKINEAVKNLERNKTHIQRESEVHKSLSDLNDKVIGMVGKDISDKDTEATSKHLGELSNLVRENTTLNNTEKLNLTTRIIEMQVIYGKYFGGENKIPSISREILNKNLKSLKEALRIERLDKRIEELNGRIENLKSDKIDVNNLINPDTSIKHEGISSAIAEKEHEIADMKNEWEHLKSNAIIKARARKTGLFGFKDPKAIKTKEFLLYAKREFWEAPRTQKFMFDISVIFQQASPFTVTSLTEVKLNELVKGNFANAFASQRNMAKMFKETVLDVVKSDFKALDEARARGDENAWKRAKGIKALELLKDIYDNPLYSKMKKGGLDIQESRSLSKNAEQFHSDLHNKIGFLGLGFAKDVSADIMVSPLNAIRVQLFEAFHYMDPMASDEDVARVCEFINQMTGATKMQSGVFNFVFSAARYTMSRLSLAFVRPWNVALKIDVPATFKNRELTYQTLADKFMAKQMVRMWKGYAKMFAALALISAIHPGVDFVDDLEKKLKNSFDPNETDFLRVRSDKTSYDFMGGLGAMYRMAAKTILLATGPTDNASYLAKERDNYTKNIKHEDSLLDPAMTTLFRYRLHPTITGINSVLTGKDFFGKTFHRMFGPSETGSRTEALVRSIMPIYIETTMDQLFDLKEQTDGIKMSDVERAAFISFVQGLGVNTLTYNDGSQSLISKDYFNKIEFTPGTDYPKELNEKDHVNDNRLEYLRMKYKKEYGDMVGETVESDPNASKSVFQSRVKQGATDLKRKFVEENSEGINKLEKKGK